VIAATVGREATSREICEQFSLPNQQMVGELIEQLVTKRMLVANGNFQPTEEGPESELEIFYWHFGESAHKVTKRLNSRYIAILGVNCISRQLAASLLASDAINIQVIDFPLLRNLRLFDDHGELETSQWTMALPVVYESWTETLDQTLPDCLIATSDFGGQESLRQWNQFCVERNCHFLPVLLQNLVGFIGPLVIPGETACFECLRARQNAHFNDAKLERATEETAFYSQPFIGFHPSMASILGDIAAFELTKFYSGVLPKPNVGSLLEVNLLSTCLTARKVLKVPRCLTCSPLNRKASVQVAKNTFSAARENGT
jgi:thiazole/oxazole-forming peptide maturase SagC family component